MESCLLPSLLRIGTSDGTYDAADDLVEEDDESEDQIVPGLFRTSLEEANVRCPSDLGHLHCACPSAQTWVTCTAEGRAWARAHARTILVGARESAQVSQQCALRLSALFSRVFSIALVTRGRLGRLGGLRASLTPTIR